MKLSELTVGRSYKCTLSKQIMLVTMADKPSTDKKGEPITEKVHAGKYVIMNGKTPSFHHDEICDGQLEEINK